VTALLEFVLDGFDFITSFFKLPGRIFQAISFFFEWVENLKIINDVINRVHSD